MPTRIDHVRALVHTALDRLQRGEAGDRVLDRILRANRDLTSEERRLVATWSLGIALWRGRLDLLSRGDRAFWLALYLVDREHLPVPEAAALADVDPDRLSALLVPPIPATPVDRLVLERSIPAWLAARWITQFGEARADALAAATNERGPITIRANLLRTTRDALAARLATEGVATRPGLHAPTALHLEGRPNVFGLAAWRDGLFEVQDEGSQLVADALAVRPGERVVDLCAGSGGKTLALAAAQQGRGSLFAVDLEPARLADLVVRARRAGVENIQSIQGDACDPRLLSHLAGQADAVLVDAPCSSTGVLRRGPDARWRLDPHVFERWAPVQRDLLAAGAALVAPGGRLAYATCSVDRAENEDVASTFAAPGFRLVGTRTLFPDTHGTDGFFVAIWSRDA